MKKSLYFLLSLFSLIACSDSITEDAVTTTDKSEELSKTVSSTAEVTGLTRFTMANLNIPSSGLYDGRRFYTNGIMRANTAYYPYSIMKQNRNGIDRIRFYVKPTSPSEYLATTPYDYHYRAEICRYPWKINTPLGTEEWLGFSYFFPTASEGYTQNQTPVSIFQNHDGVNSYPTVQIEIAYPNQLFSPYASRFYYNTPLGGELMIINHVRGIRWVVPNFRVVAGTRLDIVVQMVYGTGSNGLFNVWINGKLQTWPGGPEGPAGNVGSTVYSNALWGGNSKLGLYHHQMRYKSGVDKNAAKGHTNMKFWMGNWNDVFRKPGDWDYKNSNAYAAVSTAGNP
jgi:hypothetical protein